MTSNSEPYGLAECSSHGDANDAWYAFAENAPYDSDLSKNIPVGWTPLSSDSFGNAFVKYTVPDNDSYFIREIKVAYCDYQNKRTATVSLYGLNMNNEWELLSYNQTVTGSLNADYSYIQSNINKKYKAIKLIIESTQNNFINQAQGYRIRVYGVRSL